MKRMESANIGGVNCNVQILNEFYVCHVKNYPFHIWKNKLYISKNRALNARPLKSANRNFWTVSKVTLKVVKEK